MKNIKSQTNRNWLKAALIITFLVLCLFLYFNITNIRKSIGYGIYSNTYHYLDCNQLPDYIQSKTKFTNKVDSLLNLVKDLESDDKSDSPYSEIIIYSSSDTSVEGGFITIKLDNICSSKAEINVTVTSNKYTNSIIKFINSNLAGIPFNIVNN